MSVLVYAGVVPSKCREKRRKSLVKWSCWDEGVMALERKGQEEDRARAALLTVWMLAYRII